MARERRRHRRDDDGQRGQGGDDLHGQIFEMLLDKVRDDPYPSTTHLDMIESILQGDDEVESYADVLLEKVRLDDYPSFDHLNRLMKLA